MAYAERESPGISILQSLECQGDDSPPLAVADTGGPRVYKHVQRTQTRLQTRARSHATQTAGCACAFQLRRATAVHLSSGSS